MLKGEKGLMPLESTNLLSIVNCKLLIVSYLSFPFLLGLNANRTHREPAVTEGAGYVAYARTEVEELREASIVCVKRTRPVVAVEIGTVVFVIV